VVNPRSLIAQLNGGSCLGIAHALFQKWVIDPQYGITLARRFHYNKPPTILDAPNEFKFAAMDIADPETPVGVRGIGEPPVGAGLGAILNALSDALGDDVYRRAPVTLDSILMALEHGRPMQDPLTAHI
jgi:CO/xanthine dehydrogenase Mo-binding subunit